MNLKIILLSILLFTYFNSTAQITIADSIMLETKIDSIGSIVDIRSSDFVNKIDSLGYKKQIINSPFFTSKYYNILGEIFTIEMKLDSANYYISKAIEIRQTHQYLPYLATSYETIAILNRVLGENTTALNYLKKSLVIKEKIGNSTYLKGLYVSLGNIYTDFDNYDTAFYYYIKAQNICITQKDTQGIASTYNNVGNILYYQDLDSSALVNYKKAFALYRSIKRYGEMVSSLVNIGNVYDWLNNSDSALFYYNLAYINAKKTQTNINLSHILSGLTETYTLLGEKDSSVRYLKEYINYRDSVFSTSKVNTILKFETQFQTKEKEQALKLEKIVTKNNKNIIFGLLTLLAFGIIMLIILLRYFRQKKKVNLLEIKFKNQKIDQLLKEQEAKTYSALIEGQNYERERIAQDLHDRLGGTLAAVKIHFNLMDQKIDVLKIENENLFDKMNTMLDQAVHDVRSISHDLTSGKLNQLGLKGTINDLVITINSAKEIEFDFVMTDDVNVNVNVINKKIEQEVYSIIQELVSNTLKHAKANYVELNINLHNDLINIIYEDNGIGFIRNNILHKGMGLAGIEKRVHILKGSVKFDSVLKRGTIVIINIPIV